MVEEEPDAKRKPWRWVMLGVALSVVFLAMIGTNPSYRSNISWEISSLKVRIFGHKTFATTGNCGDCHRRTGTGNP